MVGGWRRRPRCPGVSGVFVITITVTVVVVVNIMVMVMIMVMVAYKKLLFYAISL